MDATQEQYFGIHLVIGSFCTYKFKFELNGILNETDGSIRNYEFTLYCVSRKSRMLWCQLQIPLDLYTQFVQRMMCHCLCLFSPLDNPFFALMHATAFWKSIQIFLLGLLRWKYGWLAGGCGLSAVLFTSSEAFEGFQTMFSWTNSMNGNFRIYSFFFISLHWWNVSYCILWWRLSYAFRLFIL